MGIQTALLGKASFCYLEPAASFEFQPWQSASQKLNEKTHPLNVVGPLVVDDFDGANLELNHLPSTLLSAWQQPGCPPKHPGSPWGTRSIPRRARRYLWHSYIWPAAVGSVRLPPPRHDKPNKWSMRLLLPGWRAFFFLKTRAKSCWWANCPNRNWAGQHRTFLSLITDWCLLEMGWYSSIF